MSDSTPDWAKQLADAVAEFGKGMERVGQIATAQAAIGWLVQGELERAQREVARLPADQLDALAVAATALASLAEEEARKRTPELGQ